MNAIKTWKAQNRARWQQLPFKTKMGILSGLNGFNAAMIAIIATSGLRGGWGGLLLGAWIGFELLVIVLLITTRRKQVS